MSILGTAPGLIRHRITNLSEQDWRALIFGGESRDAPPAETADTTAALAYAAADLTPKGGSEVKEVEGEKVIEHASLTAGWLTILNSEHLTHGHLTHAGIRRVWLRAEDLGEEAGDVELRLRYRSLGSLAWTTNRIVPSPLIDDWQWLDMGECRLDAAVLGDERWEFEVQARVSPDASGGAGKVRLHRVAPLPTEQYVVLRAPEVSQGSDGQEQNSPGTVSNVEAGAEDVSWASASNAKASDDARASVNLEFTQFSDYLQATNFGFEIPEAAVVVGVVVEIEREREGISIEDATVRLVKSGAVQGHNKARVGDWPTSDTYQAYGGSDDLWLLDLTPADINSSNFGVALRARFTGVASSATARVDHIRITVYYSEAAGAGVCFAGRSLEIRSETVARQHPTDDVWGKIPAPGGSYPTAPPSGLEERPYRAILIPSQGDLDTLPDSGDNPLSAQAHVRPGYGYAREAAS